jgi:hypothetical protein
MAKPQRPKGPAKPVLGFSQLTTEQKIAEVKNILVAAAKSDDLAQMPAVKVALDSLQRTVADAVSKVEARNLAKQALTRTESDVVAADVLLSTVANTFVHSVDDACHGDESKIRGLGLNIAAPKTSLTAPPDAPTDVVAKPGSDVGSADLTWTKPKGSKSFLVQWSSDPVSPTSWVHGVVTTKARATLTGLGSGKLLWVRIKSVGSLGEGPWSTPVAVTPH